MRIVEANNTFSGTSLIELPLLLARLHLPPCPAHSTHLRRKDMQFPH